MRKYKVIVKAKDSECPHIKNGDKFVIEGPMINLKETNAPLYSGNKLNKLFFMYDE